MRITSRSVSSPTRTLFCFAADVKCILHNEDVCVFSCLVDLAPCLFQPLKQQGNASLFVMFVREELSLLGVKCHAGSKVHCYTNCATSSPHMSTVPGAWVVTVPIKHNNCSVILPNDIYTVLLKYLVMCGSSSPRDTIQESSTI